MNGTHETETPRVPIFGGGLFELADTGKVMVTFTITCFLKNFGLVFVYLPTGNI